MPRFYWRKGFESRVNAEIVGAELERIRRLNNETLTPEDVLTAAERRGSPLHPLFTWDDSEAARKYRLTEARRIVQGILIEHPRRDREPLIAYLSVRTEERGRCYKESRVVMNDDELEQQARQECQQMIDAWRRRYSRLEQIKKALDAFEEELEIV